MKRIFIMNSYGTNEPERIRNMILEVKKYLEEEKKNNKRRILFK